MKALLFRRMEIEGKNYYQLYKLDLNFKEDLSFADFDNRNSKEYFYLEEKDSDKISDEIGLYGIYCENDDNKLVAVTPADLFAKIFMKFKDKYHITIREIKSSDEIVEEVRKKIMYQDNAVYDLVDQIYLNQQIMASDLPRELKITLKNNILFHGLLGSGKKTIVKILEENLNIPYADITIGADVKDTIRNIIEQLLEKSGNCEEASNGIVFIHDNYKEISNVFGNPLSVINFINSQGIISYGENKIDFQKLTFVVLFDELAMLDEEVDIDDIKNLTNCLFDVKTKVLTNREKYNILNSENGRISEYRRFIEGSGKEFVVDKASLEKIIRGCSKVDLGMNILNNIIDGIVKMSILEGIDDVYIDEQCVLHFLPALAPYSVKKEKIEKKKEEIVNDGLKEIFAKVVKDVVGQDRAVKRILYKIFENQRMIRKKDLSNPKQYVDNILVRGDSGSGKTFIIETIARYLNIPIYIADATQYTKEGYYGLSTQDLLSGLITAAGGDIEKAQTGIIAYDEVDKKANKSNNDDISGAAVQDSLLKIAEGSKISVNIGTNYEPNKIMFDTSKVTLIGLGAFEGIEKYRDKRVGKTQAGFRFKDDDNSQKIDVSVNEDDYVEFGMRRQFIGRLPMVVDLVKNTKESLINVMKNSDSSALKVAAIKLGTLGIQIEYKEDFYEKLAEDALRRKLGVRGIKSSLEKVLSDIHIEDIVFENETQKIVFTGDMVSDPSKIILIPKGKQKKLKNK